jgi:hypothetical protein
MPNELNTPQDIASAALALWDMEAEESENELALSVAITGGLVEQGLEKEHAALTAALLRRALAEAASPGKAVMAPQIADHPVFKALLAEIQGGGWDLEAIRSE